MSDLTLFDGVPEWTPVPAAPTLDEHFTEFDAANPRVMEAFARLARDEIRRGARRVSINYLFEVVRYHYRRATTDEHSDFKLNNNLRSRYSRELMRRHPDLEGVFETRELRAA